MRHSPRWRFIVGVVAIVVLVVLLVAAAVVRAHGRGRARTGGGLAARRGPAEKTVEWPEAGPCFSRALMEDIHRAVRAFPGFGPLSPAQETSLGETAAVLSKKYRVRLAAGQLVAVRTMETALESQRAGVRALRHGKKIAEAVSAGRPVQI